MASFSHANLTLRPGIAVLAACVVPAVVPVVPTAMGLWSLVLGPWSLVGPEHPTATNATMAAASFTSAANSATLPPMKLRTLAALAAFVLAGCKPSTVPPPGAEAVPTPKATNLATSAAVENSPVLTERERRLADFDARLKWLNVRHHELLDEWAQLKKEGTNPERMRTIQFEAQRIESEYGGLLLARAKLLGGEK